METRFLCIHHGTIWIGIQGWKWVGFSKKAPFIQIWFPTREV